MSDYFICPNCGAAVDADAVACPDCGSDDETGWSAASAYDGLLPYDSEPVGRRPRERSPYQWLMGLIAAFTIIAFLTMVFDGNLLLVAVIVLLAAAALYLWNWQRQQPQSEEEALYHNLLAKVFGDAAAVERLINYERGRSPHADRITLLRDAIERWERANR